MWAVVRPFSWTLVRLWLDRSCTVSYFPLEAFPTSTEPGQCKKAQVTAQALLVSNGQSQSGDHPLVGDILVLLGRTAGQGLVHRSPSGSPSDHRGFIPEASQDSGFIGSRRHMGLES